MAFSTAPWLITGSTPGCPRQSGQVSVFGSAPNRFSQRQNIFVSVFSWTWISRPITGSHSVTVRHLLRRAQRLLDRAADVDVAEAVLEHAFALDQPQLALTRLELQFEIAQENRARAVE